MHDLLYSDPRFWALKPSQGRALPILIGLMAEHGQEGELRWTRKELQSATRLGPKLYADLLQILDRHAWGCETPEGWLVLCGPLAPATPPPGVADPDLHAVVTSAIAAAIPAAIRHYEADRKRRARSRTEMSGTTAPVVPDNPSHVRAPVSSSISNRVEEDINISFDSNPIDRSMPAPPAIPTPHLTLQTSDLVQALLRHGIPEDNARALLKQHGAERLVLVLASVPHWKSKNPAAVIQDALKRPEKWPIPAAVAQQGLPLLTDLQPTASTRPALAIRPTERQPDPAHLTSTARAQPTTNAAPHPSQPDNDAIEQAIWSRLPQPTRQKILECQDLNLPLPPLVQGQWDSARRTVLAESPPRPDLPAQAASG